MHQTLVEKIFSRLAGHMVQSGEFVTVEPDRMMCHEAFEQAAQLLCDIGLNEIWDSNKIIIILDHFVPVNSENEAISKQKIRVLSEKYSIRNYLGESHGVCHQVMFENGFVRPGELILGTDSHTTTYGAVGCASAGIGPTEMAYVMATGKLWFMVPETIKIKFTGKPNYWSSAKDISLAIINKFGNDFANYKAIEYHLENSEQIGMYGRKVLCNMGAEMGAKIAMFPPDGLTAKYLCGEKKKINMLKPDKNAEYCDSLSLNVSKIDPMVAMPHNTNNVEKVANIAGKEINQAYLGSCTGGYLEDLKIASKIINRKKIPSNVRFLVYPASRRIYIEAIKCGYINTLLEAGAIIGPPSCGACFGSHGGVLAPNEICISTTNRNFKGRMGSRESEVYLASAATVAASAIAGRICDPREV